MVRTKVMKFLWLWMIVGSVAVVGCSTTKSLMTVSPAQRERVCLVMSTNTATHGSFATVTARNAEGGAGVSSSALGAVIAGAVSASSNSGGSEYVAGIRGQTGNFEAALLHEHFLERLASSKIGVAPDRHAVPVLTVNLISFGIRETQRGFFAPYAQASASLVGIDGKTIWSAHAQSVGVRPRHRSDYDANPQLYRDDFLDLTADLARQLIKGPIRPFEQ